jgi:hypothetical protein
MFYKAIYSNENTSTKGPYIMAECNTELDFFDFEDENFENGNIDLLKFKADDKLIPDYIFNDLYYRIISGKFKNILQETVNVDNMAFLPVTIKTSKSELVFWLVLFKELRDVLDEEKSHYESETLHSPWFKEVLIHEDIFNFVGGISEWFVSERLMKKIVEENLKGIEFEVIPSD